MKFEEIRKDVFELAKTHTLAHCIASDGGMGAGIAVPMRKKFKLAGIRKLPMEERKHPTCVFYNGVFNLITKKISSGKPNYCSMHCALETMKVLAQQEGVTKIAMPKIGCGLDQLSWPIVRDIIKGVFMDTDIEIVVCKL